MWDEPRVPRHLDLPLRSTTRTNPQQFICNQLQTSPTNLGGITDCFVSWFYTLCVMWIHLGAEDLSLSAGEPRFMILTSFTTGIQKHHHESLVLKPLCLASRCPSLKWIPQSWMCLLWRTSRLTTSRRTRCSSTRRVRTRGWRTWWSDWWRICTISRGRRGLVLGSGWRRWIFWWGLGRLVAMLGMWVTLRVDGMGGEICWRSFDFSTQACHVISYISKVS